MKKYILLTLLGMAGFAAVMGQTFKLQPDIPFGIQPVRPDSTKGALNYIFTDFDHDQDLDLILTGIDSIDDSSGFNYESITYFVDYQENTGDKKHPAFAARKSLIEPFPFQKGLFMLTSGDLDADGQTDLVVSAQIDKIGAQHILYYHRLANGSFEIKTMETMGLDPLLPSSVFQPELTDLDSDGDLDLLMSGYAPKFGDTTGTTSVPVFRYAKNIGTTSHPDFIGWFINPFGIVTDTFPFQSATGDLDLDGDMDILSISIRDSVSMFQFYKNVPGSNGKPAFLTPQASPFGLPKPDPNIIFISPTLTDIDSDGDLDLFVYRLDVEEGGTLQFYENTQLTGVMEPPADYTSQITIVPNPARDELTIRNTTRFAISEIRVYTNSGTLIRKISDNLTRPITLDDLPNNLYLVEIQMSNGAKVIKKVVIMRE